MYPSLILPIKKEWFDMIQAGVKKAEYREIKLYWTKRFQNIGLLTKNGNETGHSTVIGLRNGYGKDAPKITARVMLLIDEGLPAWGSVEGKTYYVLRIVDILEGWER